MLRVVKRLVAVTMFGVMALAVGATNARAAELDLTSGAACSSGPNCTAGFYEFAGLLWTTTLIQPTGSGYIDSFLRIEGASSSTKVVVDGMNTDGALLNDEKSGPEGGANFTHDVLLSDLDTVTIAGDEYYAFLLDINQEGGDPLLTLSGLQFCQSFSGSLSFTDTCAGVDSTNPDTGTSTLKYDMNYGTNSNPGALPASCLDATVNQPDCIYDGSDSSQNPINKVLMNYSLNSGSGSGDVVVYVPTSLLPESGGDYLYLWSQFGAPTNCGTTNCPTNNDGYEEWAFLGNGGESQLPPSSVPEPGSLVLLGTGLLFGGHLIRRRNRKQQAAKSAE